MITVYGADWCEDTRRSLRHLRRLAVAHEYVNIDEDLDALHRATSLNGGQRRTPTIDLGIGGPPLVEPDNDSLTGALIEMDMLTREDAHERLGVQNVGDLERVLRTSAGLILVLAGGRLQRQARSLVRITGALLALSGLAGWCPAYHAAGLSSLDGPGDRPGEAHRRRWLGLRTHGSTQADADPGLPLAESAR
jgi:glutaredoxin-related protein